MWEIRDSSRESVAVWLLTIPITYHGMRIWIRLNSSSLNYFDSGVCDGIGAEVQIGFARLEKHDGRK